MHADLVIYNHDTSRLSGNIKQAGSPHGISVLIHHCTPTEPA